MATRSIDTETILTRFQAVGEETRLQIIRLLAGGERCVCELQEELGAAQSRLSFHLKRLKDAGVISDRREGRWVHYSLVPEALEEMKAFLETMEPREGSSWRGGSCCS